MTQQFRRHFNALSRTVPVPLLHRLMFLFFLRRNGRLPAGRDSFREQLRALPLDQTVGEPSDAALAEVADVFERFDWWRLEEQAPDGALTPRVLADTFEQSVNRRQTGTYYTGRDVAEYIVRATILPRILDDVAAACPRILGPDGSGWQVLRDFPEVVLQDGLRYGTDRALPDGVARPDMLDRPAAPELGLPTETWRECQERRRAYEAARERLRAGSVRAPDDLVAWNLNAQRFVLTLLAIRPSGARLARALLRAMGRLTVLDPTCGCGDFLLAALELLLMLHVACLIRLNRRLGLGWIIASILRHTLHGVDLMPEAVEVCKLRLWLRWAAAGGRPLDLRRLPDLSGTIRAGDAVAGLDWPAAFPEVTRRGGFAVAVGNPPYVETATTTPPASDYRTARCGNLYALVVERALRLLAPDGRLGMIVPHSAVCTDRMAPLLRLLTEGAVAWVSTYDIRPCKLFAGVDQRLAICLCHASPHMRIYSTRYHRWHESARPHLFEGLRYVDVGGLSYANSLPKAGDLIETRIWHRIHARPPLAADLGGAAVVYYHNAPRYWVRALTFAPYFWNQRDGARLSAQVKELAVRDAADAGAVVALLNSSLFCWWWLLLSDCRHLNRREIERFPAGIAAMSADRKRALGALCRRLMADYRRHAVRKVCRYRTTGKVVYDEFYPGRSKAILDEIDRVLGGHYGLSEEETDFLIHHDIKYRRPED